MVAATAALGAGVLYGPALQRTYYLRRLDSSETEQRVDAMDHLALLTQKHAVGAARLADAVVVEIRTGEPKPSAAARIVAHWATENNAAFRRALEAGLDGAIDEDFLIRANLLERGGTWRHPQRSDAELLRREQLRLGSADSTQRRLAIRAILRHRIQPTEGLRSAIERATQDDDAEIRRYGVVAASVCLQDEAAPILAHMLADAVPGVRCEAVFQIGCWPTDDLHSLARLLATDPDPEVRRAAAWVLGRAAFASARGTLIEAARTDPAAEVRRMATWSLGRLDGHYDEIAPALAALLGDGDSIIARRAGQALVTLPKRMLPIDALLAALNNDDAAVRTAVATALAHCPNDPRIRDALGDAWPNKSNSARWPLAVAVLGALDAHGDTEAGRLLAELVSNESIAPAIRLDAALLAYQADPTSGFGCLTHLVDTEVDEMRELAAWWLTRLAPELTLDWIDDSQSAGHAGGGINGWMIALAGRCELLETDELAVLDSSTPTNGGELQFDDDWRSYGYELYARVLCSDRPNETPRDQLNTYILNRHVSRVGLFITLLQNAERLPWDLLLGDDPTLDVRSFLVDARFGDVLAHYQPDAPRVSHQDDLALQQWQLDRLRDWWRVHSPAYTCDGRAAAR